MEIVRPGVLAGAAAGFLNLSHRPTMPTSCQPAARGGTRRQPSPYVLAWRTIACLEARPGPRGWAFFGPSPTRGWTPPAPSEANP
jgi:hypothetical protein